MPTTEEFRNAIQELLSEVQRLLVAECVRLYPMEYNPDWENKVQITIWNHVTHCDLFSMTPVHPPQLREIAHGLRQLSVIGKVPLDLGILNEDVFDDHSTVVRDLRVLEEKLREMLEYLSEAPLSTARPTDISGEMQEAQVATPPQPLPAKRTDLSGYMAMADLTDRQRECFSLRFEYGLRLTQIAKRIGVRHHSIVQQHIEAANVKIRLSRNKEKARKNTPVE